MNNKIWILFLVLICLSNVSAVEINLNENYSRMENILVEIKGNFVENLVKEDVIFRRGHVNIPVEYEIIKIENKYYIWAIAPDNANDYNVRIENMKVYEDGKSQILSTEKNFSVIENKVDYYIKPKIITTKGDFKIEVYSFNYDDLNLIYGFSSQEFSLKNGNNEINVDIDSLNNSFQGLMNVGTYGIPVYIIVESNEIDEINETITEISDVRFLPKILESISLRSNFPKSYPIRIINENNEKVVLFFRYNEDFFEIKESKIEINPKSYKEFFVKVLDNESSEIDEIIIARNDEFSISLPIKIEFTNILNETNTPYLEEDFEETSLYKCRELNGQICGIDETCEGELKSSLDGLCCLDKCVALKGSGSNSWIGWALIALLAIVGFYIVFKYKKTESK
jgi:hypothetical protein